MSVRRGYLVAVLDAVVTAGEVPDPDPSDAWQLALAAFAANERLQAARGDELSLRALERLAPDADPVVRVTAFAARGFAASASLVSGGWTDVAPGLTPTGDPLADAREHLPGLGEGAEADFARYLLAEAALACARVGLASELPHPDGSRFLEQSGRAHPYGVILTVLAARVAAFHGRVDEARELLEGVQSEVPAFSLLLDATRSLVLGNAADPAPTREFAARVAVETASPENRIATGCFLLAAYGLVALDDVSGSAALVLAAGRDAGLERLMVIDRAIGFELLVHAALRDGDLDAAEAWAASAAALADSAIADSTVERTRSRILLARGDVAAAASAAERAVQRARAEGRWIEATEGEILAARAAIAADAGGDAGRRLQSMAEQAHRTGHRSAVRAASHALRAAGRRLRPFAGSEWSGLSEREREVAALLLEGLTNTEIAEQLFLSPHTVRVHVSRVLAAFGVASRFALAARVPLSQPPAPVAVLTARQRAVVAEVVTGASNAEIATRLGISVKTVEKHLHEAMHRLGVTTRVGVLRRVSERDAAGE